MEVPVLVKQCMNEEKQEKQNYTCNIAKSCSSDSEGGRNQQNSNQMVDQSQQGSQQWRSNILISSTESKERSIPALRHLTSFQQKSMDNHGKKLSESFIKYINWVTGVNNTTDFVTQNISPSDLSWEQVENVIQDQVNLTQEQKNILISSGRKNTQVQFIISQIVGQIPQLYFSGTLCLASHLIKQFKQQKLQGKNELQTLDKVSQTYISTSDAIYNKLVSLHMANPSMKEHQKYFEFIKVWMEVFFLSLNGFLYNPNDRARTLKESGNVAPKSFSRKNSNNYS